MSIASKVGREPVIQFGLIGLLLILVFNLITGFQGGEKEKIVVTQPQVDRLVDEFSRRWMRPPTQEELTGLVRNHVREEIYYREALAMGLDENDQVIRNRMRQKLEMLMDQVTSSRIPSERELMDFVEANPERYRIEPRVSFQHVYLNPDRRASIGADAQRILEMLRSGADPESLGDSQLLDRAFKSAPQREVARNFGDGFAADLILIEPGGWEGPIESGYGLHLVRVTSREDGRLPALGEIRDVVERDWRAEQRQRLRDESFEKLLEVYDVVFEEPEIGETEGPETDETDSGMTDRRESEG